MNIQSEHALENALVQQLQSLGFGYLSIKNEQDLRQNLKRQLEIHNKTSLSENEFDQIQKKLQRGNAFDKAKMLRDRVNYKKDTGETGYIELIDQIHWCKNQYQVTNQVTMVGAYKNRYDVTLLINGLPLVQIELKRRGLELKEAFNQINRYHRHSFSAGFGLFRYIQIFIISNGENTKYFANNPVDMRDFKQTFYWADQNNKKVTNLSEFAEIFLEKCQLSKMITKYIVLNEARKLLMVLRSYQYHAVEAIVERVRVSEKFGYIWHTTGSGKTLTSFKTAQILTQSPNIYKVLFVVDRKDLDYQTIEEFNNFRKGSVDATNNTKNLVRQLSDDTRLIVTTLQKLNTAITKSQFSEKMSQLTNRRMVFIFDECHRSQFGETQRRIRNHFSRAQMFGFTGTPIFKENSSPHAHSARTTKDLFDECLHKYVITDAIRDENVLRFSIEYIRTIRQKKGIKDIEVEAINKVEVMEAEERIDAIVDHIIDHHDRKTHSRKFTAIFCVSNIKLANRYYQLFLKKNQSNEHKLRIAGIFSYQANEDDSDPSGSIETDLFDDGAVPINRQSRDLLEAIISDYNKEFSQNFSTNSFYGFYQDVSKKAKEGRIDILIVVNMFLTGFDCPTLNTIYVDKNLRHHGLIQAYSRTNRIFGKLKSQGNVVCYRNLKEVTDSAIELFANKDAIEDVILEPYETVVEKFAKAVDELKKIAPTPGSVDELQTEQDDEQFIQVFRELIRLMNVLVCFVEFRFEDLAMDAQQFENYKSKYLDLYDRVRTRRQKEKVSILDDIDFELELIHRDEINVGYILALLQKMRTVKESERNEIIEKVRKLLDSEVQLRSKKELIERFVAEQLESIPEDAQLRESFDEYWEREKEQAIQNMSLEEDLDPTAVQTLIDEFVFTQNQLVLERKVIDTKNSPPKLLERDSTIKRLIDRIIAFVETFVDGVD